MIWRSREIFAGNRYWGWEQGKEGSKTLGESKINTGLQRRQEGMAGLK